MPGCLKIRLKYIKLRWMLIDETQLNLSYKARIAKRTYIFIKPVLRKKILFFPNLKISYLKDSSF